MIKDANFSDCGKYRYELKRIWDDSLIKTIVIMLNPSTADHEKDDPTIKKLTNIIKHSGYGGMYIYNLWPIISSDPKILKKITKESAEFGNDIWMRGLEDSHWPIIFAWGVPGGLGNEFVHCLKSKAFCFGKNNDGSPKHPLYLKNETKIVKY